MRETRIAGFLGVVTLGLIGCVVLLWFTLTDARRQTAAYHERSVSLQEELRSEHERLDLLRARLEDRLSLLSASESAWGKPLLLPSPGSVVENASPIVVASPSGEFSVPDLLSIPLLTAEEREYLDALREEMPSPPDGILLSGDVADVLTSPEWNPNGRELSDAEREMLEELLPKYRVFSRMAPKKRFLEEILPEIERMRSAEAYVDYPVDAIVHFPGITISHGEMPKDKPGYKRLYFFFPEDHPNLYHEQRVEEERAYETYVKVYHLINGTL